MPCTIKFEFCAHEVPNGPNQNRPFSDGPILNEPIQNVMLKLQLGNSL